MLTPLIAASLVAATPITVTRVQSFDTLKTISLAGSPANSPIFAAGLENGSVRLFNAATRQSLHTLSGHPQAAYALAFTPNGQQLVTGDETARIWVWDVRTGRKLREFPRGVQYHQRGIQAISFSRDGRIMATTGKDDTIIFWNFADMTMRSKVPGSGVVFGSATFTPQGMIVATLTRGLQFRTAGGAAGTQVEGHGGLGVNELALNAAGTRAVTAGRDNALGVWDVAKKKRIGSLRGHEDWVVRAAIAPNGRVAASSSTDRKTIIWDLVRMTRVAELADQSSIGAPLAFTGDGRFLISVNINDGLQINSVSPAQSVPAKAPARRRR